MRAILTYHSIDRSGSPISVAPEEFRRHVAWLASGRVRVVSLADLVGLPPDAEAVTLTFDDGFANFAAEAAPLLGAHALPATLYVVAGHAGGDNAWGGRSDPRVPRLPLLDWPAICRMAEQGVELGAHTRTHPHLTRVSASALEDELAGAADTIRRETGRVVSSVAYPFGDADSRVTGVARRHFTLGVTTELRALAAGEDSLLLPRLDMFYLRAPGRLEAWGTSRFAGRLWFRAQARRLRASLSVAGGGW